jgi:hypothetical protein
VIRRAFWLSVGAAAGITGYRRVTALGRAISVRAASLKDPAASLEDPATAAGVPATRARPGPVHYRAAQSRPVQWSAARTAWRTSRAAWRAQKAILARMRAAGLFARDVREGMDLYMNRHQPQPGPTLADTRSNRRPPTRPQ